MDNSKHNFCKTSEHKEQIEKAEEKERLLKEKEEKEKREVEEKRKAEVEARQENGEGVVKADGEEKITEGKDDDKIGSLDDSPLDQVRLAFQFIYFSLVSPSHTHKHTP